MSVVIHPAPVKSGVSIGPDYGTYDCSPNWMKDRCSAAPVYGNSLYLAMKWDLELECRKQKVPGPLDLAEDWIPVVAGRNLSPIGQLTARIPRMSDDKDASIFERADHDAQNPWAQISRALIRDTSISLRCRMMLIWLFSHSDNWQFIPSAIAKYLDCCRNIMYKTVNEAIEAGYIRRDKRIDPDTKQFVGYSYKVSETPRFKGEIPRPTFPDTEKPDTAKWDVKIKQETSSLSRKINGEEKGAPPPIASRIEFGNVSFSEKEWVELCEDFSEEVCRAYAWKLDSYYSHVPQDGWANRTRKWILDDKAKAALKANPVPAQKEEISIAKQNEDFVEKAQQFISRSNIVGFYLDIMTGADGVSRTVELKMPNVERRLWRLNDPNVIGDIKQVLTILAGAKTT